MPTLPPSAAGAPFPRPAAVTLDAAGATLDALGIALIEAEPHRSLRGTAPFWTILGVPVQSHAAAPTIPVTMLANCAPEGERDGLLALLNGKSQHWTGTLYRETGPGNAPEQVAVHMTARTTTSHDAPHIHILVSELPASPVAAKPHDTTSAPSDAQAKSHLFATVSHEIRSTLQVLIGTLDLLAETSLDRDQQTTLRLAHDGANQLNAIVNDVLDLSKAEAGKLTIEAIPTNVTDLIDTLARQQTSAAHKRSLRLSVEYLSPPPGAIKIDPTRLRQVLANLTTNAIKFTQAGSITIRVSTDQTPGPDRDGTLLVDVEDTGIGLTAEQRARLFRPYEQADATVGREYGGTGLGLSICSKLLDLMGGSISVTSVPGTGSTFHVALPYTLPTADDAVIPTLPNTTVLLIATSQSTHDLLASWIGDTDAALTTAHSAADGFLALTSTPPHALVIIDCPLSGLTAQQTADFVTTASPSSAVIIVSDQPSDVTSRPDATLRHVIKPATRQALYDAMQATLANRVAPAPAATQGRALVVEDNAVIRSVIIRHLAAAGVIADAAENGKAALDKLGDYPNTRPYDLVITDVHMPVMSGHDLLAAIRAREAAAAAPRLPVIAMTGDALASGPDAQGWNDIILKPADRPRIQSVVARWIAPGAAQPAPQTAPAVPPLSAYIDLGVFAEVCGASPPALINGHWVIPDDTLATLAEFRDALREEHDHIAAVSAPLIGTADPTDRTADESVPTPLVTALRDVIHRAKGTAQYGGAMALADLLSTIQARCDALLGRAARSDTATASLATLAAHAAAQTLATATAIDELLTTRDDGRPSA